jgi:hypothetical protein
VLASAAAFHGADGKKADGFMEKVIRHLTPGALSDEKNANN